MISRRAFDFLLPRSMQKIPAAAQYPQLKHPMSEASIWTGLSEWPRNISQQRKLSYKQTYTGVQNAHAACDIFLGETGLACPFNGILPQILSQLWWTDEVDVLILYRGIIQVSRRSDITSDVHSASGVGYSKSPAPIVIYESGASY